MEELRSKLRLYINEKLIGAVISGPTERGGIVKVKVRPVEVKGKVCFQFTESDGTKVFHSNEEQEDAVERCAGYLENGFRNLQAEGSEGTLFVKVSKKGKALIREKRRQGVKAEVDLSHNRKKKYILEPGQAVPFLVDLGVMTEDGKIRNNRYDKFRQINRFLEFVQDAAEYLPQDKEIKIVDFGCGKSYLTFALYYYLRYLKEYKVKITGLDLKEDVINRCNQLRDQYGYQDLQFQIGDIASYQDGDGADMVVSLHACDTATDYALEKAVSWNARVILSVPCCQHELNGQIQNETLAPVLKYGILKERIAALVTDGLRAELLTRMGYQVQILEFIDMEHTPKNLLIRAVKKKAPDMNSGWDDYRACRDLLQVEPMLEKLLCKSEGENR